MSVGAQLCFGRCVCCCCELGLIVFDLIGFLIGVGIYGLFSGSRWFFMYVCYLLLRFVVGGAFSIFCW